VQPNTKGREQQQRERPSAAPEDAGRAEFGRPVHDGLTGPVRIGDTAEWRRWLALVKAGGYR
jgi:hypothetical protein